VVGAVVAIQAAKDDAAAAAGRLVSQGCVIVVEKFFARVYDANEVQEVAGYMEGVLNEMVQGDCCVLHPHLDQARSGAVDTIAALGYTEVGVLVLRVHWEAVGDKCCLFEEKAFSGPAMKPLMSSLT